MGRRRWIFAVGLALAATLALPSGALAATANPTSLTFTGATFPGGSQQQTVTVTVQPTDTSAAISVTGANAGDFSATPSSCPIGDCTVTVTFSPQAAGNRTATLTVDASAPGPLGEDTSVPLTGTTAPAATLGATSLAFDPTQTGGKSAGKSTTIKNTGTAPLTITSIALAGANPGDFALGYCFTLPLTLPVGAECSVGAVFQPGSAGDRTASIVITSDAPGSPHTIALGGPATAPPPTTPAAPPPPPTFDRGPGGGSSASGAPLVSIKSPKKNGTVTRTFKARRKGKLVILNRPVTFKGLASDKDGLARVEVALVKGTKIPSKPRFRRAKLDDFAWKYALPTSEKLTPGTYTLLARATDVTGVRSGTASVSFRLR
jgi:hypothetical protein